MSPANRPNTRSFAICAAAQMAKSFFPGALIIILAGGYLRYRGTLMDGFPQKIPSFLLLGNYSYQENHLVRNLTMSY